jgi:hypothetical protein
MEGEGQLSRHFTGPSISPSNTLMNTTSKKKEAIAVTTGCFANRFCSRILA